MPSRPFSPPSRGGYGDGRACRPLRRANRAGGGGAQLARFRRRDPSSVRPDVWWISTRSLRLPSDRATRPFHTGDLAGDQLAVGRDFREVSLSQRLFARTDFLRCGNDDERRPAIRRAALDDRLRSTYVRAGTRRTLRARLFRSLQTIHSVRIAELVVHPDRFGAGRL